MTTYNAVMNPKKSDSPPIFSDEDVLVCMRVLRAIEADRSQLTRLTQDQRRELLLLAGLVTKPERHEVSRLAYGQINLLHQCVACQDHAQRQNLQHLPRLGIARIVKSAY